jgi:hypothetical protein
VLSSNKEADVRVDKRAFAYLFVSVVFLIYCAKVTGTNEPQNTLSGHLGVCGLQPRQLLELRRMREGKKMLDRPTSNRKRERASEEKEEAVMSSRSGLGNIYIYIYMCVCVFVCVSVYVPAVFSSLSQTEYGYAFSFI